MDAFLVKPVDAALLYETLVRLVAGTGKGTLEAEPAPVVVPAPMPADGLLNVQRLESYQRLGMLEELLTDYLPEMARLVGVLQETSAAADKDRSLDALHSLLGMSGEAGAQALYQAVRRVYVPLLEHGEWPANDGWMAHLQMLATHTEQALKAYCATESHNRSA